MLVFQGDGGHRNEVLTLSWQPGPHSLLASGEQRGSNNAGNEHRAGWPRHAGKTGRPVLRLQQASGREPAASRCLLQPLSAYAPSLTGSSPCLFPRPVAGMDNHIKIWSLEAQEHTLAASDEWQPGAQVFPAALVTVPTFSTEVGVVWWERGKEAKACSDTAIAASMPPVAAGLGAGGARARCTARATLHGRGWQGRVALPLIRSSCDGLGM